MGDVYRADDLKLGQTVALKFLTHHGDAQRIYGEVRIGRQISHPNVCRLYDIAEIDGQLFITMEFVDGEDLASLLRRVGRLSSEKALAVARDICAGLAEAHNKGIIHRDLKPANVMIDGRGRARVTDFGLALAGASAADGAGTPAYMAPEQLSGGSASLRSDIYALGLMLYEIFTGRRAFEATSTNDLLSKERARDFARPSLVTGDVPAAVERLIVRCLDANPSARPDSVEEILREMPGGDPLAAAIAAGETPSPAMVAAAAENGELSRATAWGLLVMSIAGLLVYSLETSRTMLYRRIPVLESPEFLMHRVNETLATTKQPLTRTDSTGYFYTDGAETEWKGSRPPIAISPIQFYFRQSAASMSAKNLEHRVLEDDPPRISPGMADVTVDSSGRLLEFMIVPPQFEAPPVNHKPVDWSPFFRLAGIIDPVSPSLPHWAAPVDSDEKKAWTLGDGTRIEAAAYHSKPVWFAVIPPWQKPETARRPIQLVMNSSAISAIVMILLFDIFIAAGILLTIRNLRRGQGDRRGATKVAVFLFVVCVLGLTLRAHHPPFLPAEWWMLMNVAFFSAFVAIATWFGYVAMEPLVRRRWPRMLIGWSRMLAGRLRDPMIGRDVLIGTTASLVAAMLWQLTGVMPGAHTLIVPASSLSELTSIGFFAASAIVQAVVGSLMAATILLAFHVLTRNLRIAAVIYFLACTIVFVGDVSGPLWSRAVYAAVVVGIALTVFFRFGMLALAMTAVPMFFLRTIPITLDTEAWYFGRSLFALLLVAALAVYGFFVSLAGKSLLPEISVE